MRKFWDKHGISIWLINLCFVVIIVLFSYGVLFTNYLIEKKFNETTLLQKTMVACNDAANALQSDSDKLTMCVNTYVDSEAAEAMAEYYTIIDEKQREQEIAKAEKYDVDCAALREAMNLSDALAEREKHAFALIAASNGTVDAAPAQVKAFKLPQDELAMSEGEKKTLAKRLIHGNAYNICKRAIYRKIDIFQKEVLAKTEEKLLEENEAVTRYLRYLRIIALIGIVMVVHMALVLYKRVTVVLSRYIKAISENRYLEESGTIELKYLARVFNSWLAKQNEKERELRMEAEEDALTHAVSRRAMESFMKNKLRQEDASGAFVFLDADNFKSVNDTYGHNVGDALLKELVKEIKAAFRSRDVVGRIGGDEFAIWVEGASIDNAAAICEKIEHINGKYRLPDGSETEVRVSAGLTFCTFGDSYAEVLKRADTALYEKKRNGKCGCTVYENMK